MANQDTSTKDPQYQGEGPGKGCQVQTPDRDGPREPQAHEQ